MATFLQILFLLSGTRVHQELHQGTSVVLGQTWSFLSQALRLEAGEHDYEPSPSACDSQRKSFSLSAAGGLVLACVSLQSYVNVEKKVYS